MRCRALRITVRMENRPKYPRPERRKASRVGRACPGSPPYVSNVLRGLRSRIRVWCVMPADVIPAAAMRASGVELGAGH
jgi:hypothetical protein